MEDYKMNSAQCVKEEYNTLDILRARIKFFKETSTNKQANSEWMINLYDFSKPCNILDLGTGPGGFWPLLIQSMHKDTKIVLSDFSQGMVDKLNDRFKDNENITIMQMDIQDISFKDNMFDYVLANYMLHHVPDIDKAISEVNRVLKPNGVFYATTSSKDTVMTFLADTLKKLDSSIMFPGKSPFTSENGAEYLKKYFNDISIEHYYNSSIVRDVNDIIDFYYTTIFSRSMKDIDRNTLFDYYESLKDENGEIIIPLGSGTFIAKNI